MQLQLELRPRPAPPAARREGIADLIEAFLASAIDNAGTRRAYRCHLLNAVAAMKVGSLGELDLPRLAAFRALVVASTAAPATQALALSALRRFLRWYAEIGGALPFSLESARGVLRVPTVSNQSIPAVLDASEVASLRDKAAFANGEHAMFLVLVGAGLRESEACALDCTDVHEDLEGIAALRVRGKGGKQRLVPIHPPVLHGIREYLAASGRRVGERGPLFLSHDPGAAGRPDRRISARSVRRRVRRLLGRAGVTTAVRVHGLRHTYATETIRNGAKINVLQALLGHASIVTTQRYIAHLNLGELLEAVPAALVEPPIEARSKR